ncbi:unnamed protein product [Menidia menidia]|uniref:(Atlantic silverside) hypothetical protein n=1 Tax=Menidia menidia TaxID=238744 RepID=A0A8S4B414_9TELE|nr:unnamed protein product [Menidia menidia]
MQTARSGCQKEQETASGHSDLFTRPPTVKGEKVAAALASGCSVPGGSRRTLEFCLAWDMPTVSFGSREREHVRRYARFFGSKGDACPSLCHHALTHYTQWEERIEEWQRPILQDSPFQPRSGGTIPGSTGFLEGGRSGPGFRSVSGRLVPARELAEYEKVSDHVKITQKGINDIFYCEIKLKERLFSDLEQDGFCKNPFFHGIVAEVPEKLRSKDGHTKIGYALYFYSYSSWSGRAVYMEDLYVMPEFRGKGIGKALMSKVAQGLPPPERLLVTGALLSFLETYLVYGNRDELHYDKVVEEAKPLRRLHVGALLETQRLRGGPPDPPGGDPENQGSGGPL